MIIHHLLYAALNHNGPLSECRLIVRWYRTWGYLLWSNLTNYHSRSITPMNTWWNYKYCWSSVLGWSERLGTLVGGPWLEKQRRQDHPFEPIHVKCESVPRILSTCCVELLEIEIKLRPRHWLALKNSRWLFDVWAVARCRWFATQVSQQPCLWEF